MNIQTSLFQYSTHHTHQGRIIKILPIFLSLLYSSSSASFAQILMELILFIAIAPVVVIYTFVYIHDVHDVEPIKHLIISFVLGALSILPVAIVELILEWTSEVFYVSVLGMNSPHTTLTILIEAVFFIALIEELSRYLILTRYSYKLPEFSEPFDGIMYGVSVALGFAAIENVLYSMLYGQATALARAFTAIPSHAMCGVIIGYWIGKAYTIDPSKGKHSVMRRGLLIATLYHGLYDFFLLLENPYNQLISPYGKVIAIGFIPIAGYYCYRAWQEHYQVKFAPPIFATVKQEQPQLLAQESQSTRSLARLILHVHTFVLLLLGVYGFIHGMYGGEEVAYMHQYDAYLYCLLVSLIVTIELIACGLRVGSSFAWYGCLVLFLLTLFSPLFPISIIGLFGLFHPQVYEYRS